MEAQSVNHWTAREVPSSKIFQENILNTKIFQDFQNLRMIHFCPTCKMTSCLILQLPLQCLLVFNGAVNSMIFFFHFYILYNFFCLDAHRFLSSSLELSTFTRVDVVLGDSVFFCIC